LYDGEITYWDAQFGELIAELKRRGLYDDLAIVVTSDHGEEFQDHGGFWHGTTLYDEALHVPLLLKLPGNQRRDQVVTHLVQSIDLMPTLLGLAGVAVPPGVQGHELFGDNPSVFAEESLEGNMLQALRLTRAGSQLKLIVANPDNPRGVRPVELYRVDQDPSEKVDLAPEEPSLLELTRTALRDQATDAAHGRATARGVDVAADPSRVERLRALGYAGGEETKSGK
jgi:arylsulfatase A-like enzyme